MIYLIDDNQGDKRRKGMGIDFIDDGSFNSILQHYDKIEKGKDLTFLKNAACILIHQTTKDCDSNGIFLKSTTNATKIIEDVSGKGDIIPLVIFSNSMGEEIEYDYDQSRNCIYQIKKSIFYSRLYDFLQHYKSTEKIELRILAFGKHFAVEEIKRYSKLIIEILAPNPGDSIFKPTLIKPLTLLQEWHSLSTIPINYSDFCNDLEDNPISISKFISKLSAVQDSIYRYGQYIYNWAE